MIKFWAILNNATFMFKMIWPHFGQYWKKLDNFLFHYVVTLLMSRNRYSFLFPSELCDATIENEMLQMDLKRVYLAELR